MSVRRSHDVIEFVLTLQEEQEQLWVQLPAQLEQEVQELGVIGQWRSDNGIA